MKTAFVVCYLSFVLSVALAPALAGVYNVKLDTSPDRVKTPLRVDMERVGTIRPRGVGEIRSANWRLGCEILDRDYMNFDEYKEHVAPLGIKMVRLQGGWAKCEKEKGRYDFAWLDHIVDYLKAQGVEAAIETSYGNPIYEGGGSVDLAAGFPTSEEALAAWDAWVDALTRHFQGRVRTWLMWNEPDIRPRDGSSPKTPEQIAAFNVRTARIVKRNIPDAKIAGLSLAQCKSEYFEKCLNAMGEDVKLFDTFVYHGYMPAPESSYAEVEKHKAVLVKYNPDARMWQGENGCPSEMRPKFALARIAWSEYSQAKWDMRRMLGDLGHDVWSSVYTICDFLHAGAKGGMDNGMNNKGLIRANEERKVIAIKRAYYAVQNVVSVFDDTLARVKDSSFAQGFGTEDSSVTTYHYVKDGRLPLFVFWAHGRDWVRTGGEDGVLGEGKWRLPYERPGDSFETRPVVFKYTGGAPLVDPVWVDLLTGRVYAFPKERQLVARESIRFVDVPVYDSPCLLTERAALLMDR